MTLANADAARLVALAGSRIAHDLANPVGAIANGVELLGLTGLDGSPELALIAQSVENASARIKLFRIAFGAAGDGQSLYAGEVAGPAAALLQARRIALDWPAPGRIGRREAKRVGLGLLCLETALPRGGRISVSDGADGWTLAAEGEPLTAEPALWNILAGRAPAPETLTPAQVQFALLAIEAASQGRPVGVCRDPERLTLLL